MKEDISEIWALYKEAEEETTKVSYLYDSLYCVPINQLRYAGRHLLDALSGRFDQTSSRSEELLRCKRHCQRAIYDAHDMRVSVLLRRIDDFKHDNTTEIQSDSAVSGV